MILRLKVMGRIETVSVRVVGSRHGVVAQLGERVPCKHEVAGSKPVFSTRLGFQTTNTCRESQLNHHKCIREDKLGISVCNTL